MAYKHGGERAVVANRRGDPLTGAALEAYQDILDELGTNLDALDGASRAAIIGAAREGAAAELFWRAFCQAADAGDMDGMDRYVRRFGWLCGRSLRALERAAIFDILGS